MISCCLLNIAIPKVQFSGLMSYHHNLEEIWISIWTEILISFSYNQEIVSPCSISRLNLVHLLTSDNSAAAADLCKGVLEKKM